MAILAVIIVLWAIGRFGFQENVTVTVQNKVYWQTTGQTCTETVIATAIIPTESGDQVLETVRETCTETVTDHWRLETDQGTYTVGHTIYGQVQIGERRVLRIAGWPFLQRTVIEIIE